MKNEILFGIVTYKEEFAKTEAFISLLNSYHFRPAERELFVYVYDNTPADFYAQPDLDQNSEVKVTFFHNRHNPGISKAYNDIVKFAKENDFKAVVFLDQDTSLTKESYSVYKAFLNSNPNFKVAIPLINIGEKLLSPSKYINYRSGLLKFIPSQKISTKNISWINSGMMVNTNFFIKSGGYNSDIQLDFSDHFFVEKIKNQGLGEVPILPVTLRQNLSTHTNNLAQDIIRYQFFLRDLKGYRNNKSYWKIFKNVDLPRLLRLTLKHKTLKFLNIRFK